MTLTGLKKSLTQLHPPWTVYSTSSGLSRYERMIWHNRRQVFPRPPQAFGDVMYISDLGATRTVLERRACYGGRKGNSARRKLGIQPSTSAIAARATFVLMALQRAAIPDRWAGGTTDLIHWQGQGL